MPKKFLVVDDAAFMRMMICDTLKKNGYDQITEAEDGEKAVKAFNADRPDLVIMDISMPNMDGIDACKLMGEIAPDVPVILCAPQEHAYEAFDAGAKDFLVKPFTPKMLLLAVQCALDGSSGAVSAAGPSAKKVLLVDQSDSIKAALKEILDEVGHFGIAEAKDGKTAVEMFEADRPDLVITDLHIPEKDGLTACMEMRGIDAGVPVVICTYDTLVGMIHMSIRAGAKDYLMKPFKPERVKKTIEVLIG